MTVSELLDAWYAASGYTLPKRQEAWKFQVYGMQSVDDFYLFDGKSKLLFTCVDRDGITLVITVTKRD